MLIVAKQLARQEGLAKRGCQLVINTGAHGGQSVFHPHLIGSRLALFVVE
jgi:diadenosine tetraphosphate (Ap4A) HIT family hydrolase